MSHLFRRHWPLLILFLIALACRGFRATQMPVVMPDAIRHIEQAQQLAIDPITALRNEVYHPLHSVAVLAVHALWPPFHASTDIAGQRLGWARAAETVGILCGALMAPLLFSMARRLGARPWAAACAAIAWIASRRTSAYGIDGMSDMLALCLFTASMLLALRSMPSARRPLNGRQLAGLFLSGIVAGLAYLTRPEGLAAPLIISLASLAVSAGTHLCLGKHVSHDWKTFPRVAAPFRATLAALLILWAGVAIPATPYAVAVGTITQKKQAVASEAEAAEVRDNGGKERNPVIWIWLEIAKTFGNVPTIILVVTIAIIPKGWGRARHRILMLVWAAVWIAVMFWLLLAHGYLNARHTLILQVLLFPLLSLALQQVEARIFPAVAKGFGILNRHASPHHLPVVPLMLMCILVLTSLPGLLRPAWPEMLAQAKAAAWAREHVDPQTLIADRQLLVGYYAMHPYARWWGDPATEANLLREKAGTSVILGKFFEHAADKASDLPSHHPIATFTEGDAIYILYEQTTD